MSDPALAECRGSIEIGNGCGECPKCLRDRVRLRGAFEEPFAPTHKELVRRCAAWLRSRKNCGVVMAELRTMNTETPDVLGFHGLGGSILIECKASRADFHADKDKVFRRYEESGMGDVRYFAAPRDLLRKEEMPPGWGLLEVTKGRIYEVLQPLRKEANKRAEVKMLMSVLRRLEISTAVFVRQDDGKDLEVA